MWLRQMAQLSTTISGGGGGGGEGYRDGKATDWASALTTHPTPTETQPSTAKQEDHIITRVCTMYMHINVPAQCLHTWTCMCMHGTLDFNSI